MHWSSPFVGASCLMNKLSWTPKKVNIAYNVTAKFANSLLLLYFRYFGLFWAICWQQRCHRWRRNFGSNGIWLNARIGHRTEFKFKKFHLNYLGISGCGGVASGRAMAFCPSGPGSNPESYFGSFRFRPILAGCQASSNNGVIKWCLTLPCFISISYHHVIWEPSNLSTDVPRKKNKIEKEAGKGPY